jgi:hypothetical protein
MFRLKHLIPTAVAVIASAGVLAPAALAGADGLYPNPAAHAKAEAPFPRFAPKEHVTRIDDYVPRAGDRGPWVHDTPLANPVDPKIGPKVAVTGRTIPTDSGIDWTFPVMGAVALGLIIMIAGDQILVRRRGQLAT